MRVDGTGAFFDMRVQIPRGGSPAGESARRTLTRHDPLARPAYTTRQSARKRIGRTIGRPAALRARWGSGLMALPQRLVITQPLREPGGEAALRNNDLVPQQPGRPAAWWSEMRLSLGRIQGFSGRLVQNAPESARNRLDPTKTVKLRRILDHPRAGPSENSETQTHFGPPHPLDHPAPGELGHVPQQHASAEGRANSRQSAPHAAGTRRAHARRVPRTAATALTQWRAAPPRPPWSTDRPSWRRPPAGTSRPARSAASDPGRAGTGRP